MQSSNTPGEGRSSPPGPPLLLACAGPLLRRYREHRDIYIYSYIEGYGFSEGGMAQPMHRHAGSAVECRHSRSVHKPMHRHAGSVECRHGRSVHSRCTGMPAQSSGITAARRTVTAAPLSRAASQPLRSVEWRHGRSARRRSRTGMPAQQSSGVTAARCTSRCTGMQAQLSACRHRHSTLAHKPTHRHADSVECHHSRSANKPMHRHTGSAVECRRGRSAHKLMHRHAGSVECRHGRSAHS
jgi:hypothetical protein